jgi:hypothetical protein
MNTFIISDKLSSLLGLDILSYGSFIDGLLVYLTFKNRASYI